MTVTPRELLDTSITQLQMLVAFLSEQLGESDGGDATQFAAAEVRACKEILISLSALLQAAPFRDAPALDFIRG